MALINCPECRREVSDKAPMCPNCGAPIASPAAAPPTMFASMQPEPSKKKNVSCLSAGCLILLVLFFIGLVAGECGKSGGGSDSATNTTPAAPPPPSRDAIALQNVELVKFSWSTGGFDNIMMATFVIKNKNDFAVKDISLKCTHTAKSGTEIDSNTRTIYEVIQPSKTRTFRDFNMGFIHSQASASRCQIIGVVPAS
jgi:hypothetical protein